MTVVIPCYNYGHFLPALVASALAQTDVDVHVVIVDDASPDGSGEVAKRIVATAPDRVQAIIHPVNRGHIATYNDGLSAVKTEYVTLISADDLLAPGALGRAARLMEAYPRVGFVYGTAWVFETDAQARRLRVPETWTTWRGHAWLTWAANRGRNFIISPEVVMRTTALREVGGYNAQLPHSGDLEYWLRTAARWDVGRVNGRTQAFYRMHGANMHVQEYSSRAVDLRHRLAAFDAVVGPEIAPRIPDAEVLHARARQAIAHEALTLAARQLDQGIDRLNVRPLLELADDLAPGSSSSRRIVWRLARQRSGRAPSATQRTIEWSRGQADRVRAVLSEVAGIA